MKAILLAAGRGSRLGSLTDGKPKALVELNTVPLVQRAIGTLRAGGVTQVGIVAGYKSGMLSPYADRLFINPAWDRTGIFQSLSCASDWLEAEPCLVSYGDIFYSSQLVSDLINSSEELDLGYDTNAVALWQQRFENPLDDMERFAIAGGKILVIGGKAMTIEEIQGQYMGLFKLTPVSWRRLVEVRDRLPEARRENVDMTSLFSLLIQAGTRVSGTPTSEPWGEIDCPSDVHLYEDLYPSI